MAEARKKRTSPPEEPAARGPAPLKPVAGNPRALDAIIHQRTRLGIVSGHGGALSMHATLILGA